MDCDDEFPDMPFPPPSSSRSGSQTRRKSKNVSPQDLVKQFWEQFTTRCPGKVYTVLPDNPYARTKAARIPKGVIQGQDAGNSYEQAKKDCQRAVERIIKECRAVNQKYTDPHFDIGVDLKSGRRDYLDGLERSNLEMQPRGVKRVTEIFEKPQFYVNGPTASDVRQGRDGDCWFMAGLCTMGNKQGLIENICVARDETIGVYGFVFYRDDEWQQCIVDDKLYLRAADYDESVDERQIWDDIIRTDTEEEYRKVWQTGSRALYFAQCADENETWLPLLEKAYAKAHGDYSAIEGGFVGEAVEDLTGGVTSDILTSNILDKDRFWNEELMKVNKEFLFGCGTGLWSNWLDPGYKGPPRDRKGISENHSYSIMEAREIDGQRLLRLRNPWGKKEWRGAWSDGSEQWTAEWMEKLGHKFGNDGFFWISYNDLLKKYQHIDRTRLFGPEWTVTRQWTTLNVPWSADYHSNKFIINVAKEGSVVIVLSQLDKRYFKGLAGEYDFTLKFRLQKEGDNDYIVRSRTSYLMSRSVNAEVYLKPGLYHVLVKITAYRKDGLESTEDVVSRLAPIRREKLVQIGLSYDLAHAKGLVFETEDEKRARENHEKRRRVMERRKLREETKKRLERDWIRERKLEARKRRADERHFAGAGGMANKKLKTEAPLPTPPVQSALDTEGVSTNGVGSKPLFNGTTPDTQFNTKSIKRKYRSPRPLDTNIVTNGLSSYDQKFLEGFEFDSDIDMPPEEPEPKHCQPAPPCPPEEVNNDPWNAVCVVGLRVYSKDPQLCLEVVRPTPEYGGEAALDFDDPAASATNEKFSFSQLAF
ncbi:hypothetical protein ASPWEDRAFT_32621 [Aspergillus wentii DTO 134E9]|uniref:Calpain catalytic domain-containing protein n=1 Tax=Aspergillus wentii DTO 134E9 TaxID=1073089 RepID=A0A1L9R6D1_ASPWE|nr:uncharacterized protein ASPWEDRAFT_32621 [Aspergillus wentii DTO 134E9]OJJ30443.1 hypothetical protein ASPWEDRAFT_32621 [Aspergillus wentii DTO 134E9]